MAHVSRVETLVTLRCPVRRCFIGVVASWPERGDEPQLFIYTKGEDYPHRYPLDETTERVPFTCRCHRHPRYLLPEDLTLLSGIARDRMARLERMEGSGFQPVPAVFITPRFSPGFVPATGGDS